MLYQPVTPPARFELATNRLTVDGSTAELQRNGLFLLKFEMTVCNTYDTFL